MYTVHKSTIYKLTVLSVYIIIAVIMRLMGSKLHF